MRSECLACDRTGPAYQVEDSIRQAHAIYRLSQQKCGQRSDLARFQHDCATSGKRRGSLGDNLMQREVPRSNAPDDSDWFANDKRVPDLLLELISLEQIGIG